MIRQPISRQARARRAAPSRFVRKACSGHDSAWIALVSAAQFRVTVGLGSNRPSSKISRSGSVRSSSSRVAATTRSVKRASRHSSSRRPIRPAAPVIRIISSCRSAFTRTRPPHPSFGILSEVYGDSRDGRGAAVQVQNVANPLEIDHQPEFLLAYPQEAPVEQLKSEPAALGVVAHSVPLVTERPSDHVIVSLEPEDKLPVHHVGL